MENFKQGLTQYVLGHISYSNLPQLALLALQEGYESPSLAILAGLDERENTFVTEQYFKKALAELGTFLPSREEALLMELIYYVRQVVEGKLDFSVSIAALSDLLFHYSYKWKQTSQFMQTDDTKGHLTINHIEDLLQIYSLYQSYVASDVLATSTSNIFDKSRNGDETAQMEETIKKQFTLWLKVVASSDTVS